jgi:hypothetical protein
MIAGAIHACIRIHLEGSLYIDFQILFVPSVQCTSVQGSILQYTRVRVYYPRPINLNLVLLYVLLYCVVQEVVKRPG